MKEQADDTEPFLEDRIKWLNERTEFNNSVIREAESWNTQFFPKMIDFYKGLNELYANDIKVEKIYQGELDGYKSTVQGLIDAQNNNSNELTKIDLSKITEWLTEAEFTEIANKQVEAGSSYISEMGKSLVNFLKKFRDHTKKRNQEYLDMNALAKNYLEQFETKKESFNYQPNYYIPPIPQSTFFRDSALLDISESLRNISQQLQEISPRSSPYP